MPPPSANSRGNHSCCCRIAMNRASRFPAVLFKKRNIFGAANNVALAHWAGSGLAVWLTGPLGRFCSQELLAKILHKDEGIFFFFPFVNSNEKMLALMDRVPFLGGCKTPVFLSGTSYGVVFLIIKVKSTLFFCNCTQWPQNAIAHSSVVRFSIFLFE